MGFRVLAPPQILVTRPTRMTPAGRPYVMRARYLRRPRWPDYTWLLLCRGARIQAREVVFSANSQTTARGWVRTQGALWLLNDGVYEVRPEAANAEVYTKYKGNEAPPPYSYMHEMPMGGPIGGTGATHYWRPPPRDEPEGTGG